MVLSPADLSSKRQTAPAVLANEIRQAIIRGEFAAGKPIRQTEIADRFGVSRIPVREALSQLEGEGWVSSIPHRGMIVTGISAEDLRDICDMRVELETRALALAMPKMTQEHFENGERLLENMIAEPDLQVWNDKNIAFHLALYEAADRPRLLALIRNLHQLMHRYLVLEEIVRAHRPEGDSEHRAILNACRERATDRAVELLRNHICDVVVALEKFLPER